MATTAPLTELLEEVVSCGQFSPCAHYDADADALTFYLSNEPDHGQRLNSRVTIYLSDESQELVGCRIKGVRRVLEDLGWFDVSIKHGRVKLSMLFVALHGTFSDDDGSRRIYRRLGEAVVDSGIEVVVPQAG